MSKSSSSDGVFVFHNATVYQSDVSCLQDGQWLNDNVISYAFEQLQHDVFHGCKIKKNGLRMHFLSPGTSFVAMHENDQEDLFNTLKYSLTGVQADSSDIVFCPLSDASIMSFDNAKAVDKGCHWSLLVYVATLNKFFHYDSCGQMHYGTAKKLAGQLALYFCRSKTSNDKISSSDSPVSVEVGACGQQTNGCDCGVYTICNAETIATLCQQPDTNIKLDVSIFINAFKDNIDAKIASTKRKALRAQLQKHFK